MSDTPQGQGQSTAVGLHHDSFNGRVKKASHKLPAASYAALCTRMLYPAVVPQSIINIKSISVISSRAHRPQLLLLLRRERTEDLPEFRARSLQAEEFEQEILRLVVPPSQ